MAASSNGCVDVMKELLRAPGIDVDVQCRDGSTALHVSYKTRSSTAAVCELLLQNGANMHLLNNKGRTALQEMAASRATTDAVFLLLHHLVGTRGKSYTDVALGIMGGG